MGTMTESCMEKTGVTVISNKQTNKYFFMVQFSGRAIKLRLAAAYLSF